ncbi:MAG: CRISPR-associated endonuclease Cas1 [Planctomycetes bacterium]|nr:CRISPR-associated endonuclease Cas1 [Planctomycetota bacterium]
MSLPEEEPSEPEGSGDGQGASPAELSLVPARMINEYLYCPRLAYLEWIQGEWAPNVFTAEGSYAHRRVDRHESSLGPPEPEADRRELRSVTLVSEALGLIAKADLVEIEGARALPVDTKRGKVPQVEEGAYLPERAQVCVQALILRDQGYEVPKGALYFSGSKKRVNVSLSAELQRTALGAAQALRELAAGQQTPPPLVADPKCDGCSLAPLCLPDEINLLCGKESESPLRLVRPPRADAQPLYVQEQGSKLGISGDRLVVRLKGEQIGSVRLEHTSHVAVFGGVQVSTQALRRLAQSERVLAIYSAGGWFYGWVQGHQRRSLDVRRAQFRTADEERGCLHLARRFIQAKIANQRTLLRRNHPGQITRELERLVTLRKQARHAENLGSLLGFEGMAARIYWGAFPGLLKEGTRFMPSGRNRRPPRDPVNAVLSFLAALLTKDALLACSFAGLDPSLGFLHQPRPGKPALALDLMEEFRPLVIDSTTLRAFNTGNLTERDFVFAGDLGTTLSGSGRKKVLGSYEQRLGQSVTHPVFGYQVSYRQVLSIQARLLGRYLTKEVPEYPEFLTR